MTSVADPDTPDGAVAERAASEKLRFDHAVHGQVQVERARRTARKVVDDEEGAGVGRSAVLTPATEYRTRAVRWTWARRIPVGEITLVSGREGVGKSTWFAHLAAEVTRGTLDGHWYGVPKDVFYVATEDSWEHTIKPRMLAAGADLSRVFDLSIATELSTGGKPVLPVDIRHVVAAARSRDPAVLLLDPMISLISDKINTFKGQELRTALEPLKRAAEEMAIAVVGLVHMNKAKDSDALTLIAGARTWAEVARAVITIARDKDAEEYTCVVSQTKNNLGRLDLAHPTYTIDSAVVETDDGEQTEVGRLRWTGESDRSAEELLGDRKPDGSGSTVRAVVDFVSAKYHETGSGVETRAVVEAFAATVKADTVRQLLVRAVSRRLLRKVGYALYAPGLNAPRMCQSRGCGNEAEDGRPVCKPCREALDEDDRNDRNRQGQIWDDEPPKV